MAPQESASGNWHTMGTMQSLRDYGITKECSWQLASHGHNAGQERLWHHKRVLLAIGIPWAQCRAGETVASQESAPGNWHLMGTIK